MKKESSEMSLQDICDIPDLECLGLLPSELANMSPSPHVLVKTAEDLIPMIKVIGERFDSMPAFWHFAKRVEGIQGCTIKTFWISLLKSIQLLREAVGILEESEKQRLNGALQELEEAGKERVDEALKGPEEAKKQGLDGALGELKEARKRME